MAAHRRWLGAMLAAALSLGVLGGCADDSDRTATDGRSQPATTSLQTGPRASGATDDSGLPADAGDVGDASEAAQEGTPSDGSAPLDAAASPDAAALTDFQEAAAATAAGVMAPDLLLTQLEAALEAGPVDDQAAFGAALADGLAQWFAARGGAADWFDKVAGTADDALVGEVWMNNAAYREALLPAMLLGAVRYGSADAAETAAALVGGATTTDAAVCLAQAKAVGKRLRAASQVGEAGGYADVPYPATIGACDLKSAVKKFVKKPATGGKRHEGPWLAVAYDARADADGAAAGRPVAWTKLVAKAPARTLPSAAATTEGLATIVLRVTEWEDVSWRYRVDGGAEIAVNRCVVTVYGIDYATGRAFSSERLEGPLEEQTTGNMACPAASRVINAGLRVAKRQ